MKHSSGIRKIIALVLTLSVIFSMNAAAASAEAVPQQDFSFTVHPEKQEYAEGEEIKFIAELHNTTAYAIENAVISAEVPESETYLTRGTSEVVFDLIETGDTVPCEFRFSEYEAVLKIGSVLSKLSELPASVFRFFVWQYNAIASAFVTVSTVFKSAFSANIAHLFSLRARQQLEPCKVTYNGVEYEFGFHITYEKKLIKEEYKTQQTGEAPGCAEINATLSESGERLSGVIFGADFENDSFNGYVFYINPQRNTAGVIYKNEAEFSLLAEKKVTLEKGIAYEAKIISDSSRAVIYLYNNPADKDPYPIFDIPVSKAGDSTGTYTLRSSQVNINSVSETSLDYDGETYINPVMDDGADPYVLYHDGVYYMYITNSYSWNGFEAYTSENLYDWEYAGVVAQKGDIIGGGNFWAPEVYSYNGRFYMFYSADEHTAIAVSDSPLGPFVRTSDDFVFDFRAIDSSLFFDDDGRIYMYFCKVLHDEGEGQQIWGCEMNEDLLSVKTETLTLITSPNKGWEGWVNEGPFMLKHNGTYYLTYSGDFYFNKYYAVGCATSDSPLGIFAKYGNNPVLKPDSFVHGTGHHAFVTSAQTGEMFIIYHCHSSVTQVHNRKICIDRVKFVPSENGIDILTVYGPTVTAQPR